MPPNVGSMKRIGVTSIGTGEESEQRIVFFLNKQRKNNESNEWIHKNERTITVNR